MTFEDLVVLVHWDFNEVDRDKLLSTDRNLISAIKNKKRKLISNSIEVFDRQFNLLVTEEGWYGAIFGDTVKDVFGSREDVKYHYPKYKK